MSTLALLMYSQSRGPNWDAVVLGSTETKFGLRSVLWVTVHSKYTLTSVEVPLVWKFYHSSARSGTDKFLSIHSDRCIPRYLEACDWIEGRADAVICCSFVGGRIGGRVGHFDRLRAPACECDFSGMRFFQLDRNINQRP